MSDPGPKRRKSAKACLNPSIKQTASLPPTSSFSKRMGFRLAAAIGLPVVLLLSLELGLRIAGCGYPTSFFLEREIGGRRSLLENTAFGRRFFPQALVRTPRPTNLPCPKAPDAVRIFVLGESAAMGDPDPLFGMPRMLHSILSQRFPEKKIEVVNAAMVAINSHVILPIARDCARQQGDLWVIYMGNNEMIGPYGSVTVLGAQTPPRWMIQTALGLKQSKIVQVADLAWQGIQRTDPTRSDWGGMSMWSGQAVAPDDPKTARVYANFRANLAEILQAANRAGVRVLLCTVATNIRDCAPFGSLHRKNLTQPQVAAWENHWNQGKSLQAEKKWSEAAETFRAAMEIDPQYAELAFRRAQCLAAAGRFQEAQDLFRQARDSDALQFRTDSQLNEIIRELAASESRHGVELLDMERLFAEASPRALTGQDYFYEHVHLTPEGNYLLTRSIVEQIERILASKLNSSANATAGPWLGMADCFRYMGLVDWNRHETLLDLLKRIQQPPFLEQVNHTNQIQYLQEQEVRYRAASKSTQVAKAAQQVAALAAARPEDADLVWNAAQLLEVAGEFEQSERCWKALIQLRPNSDLPHYNLARLLETRPEGRAEEIEQLYRQALTLAPRTHDAHYAYGCFLLRSNRPKEAIPHFLMALRLRPDQPETHFRLAAAYKETGELKKAEEQLQIARKLDPGSGPGR